MPSQLDLSNVISVTIMGTPSGLGLPNINTAALFSTETPVAGWGDNPAYKLYTSASAVVADFGSGSKAAQIATAFFSQVPNPLSTNGYLAVILRQAAETTAAAITRTKDSVYYFGILLDEVMTSGLDTLATAVQALDKMLFVGSATVGDIAGIFTTLKTASDSHTRAIFYSDADKVLNVVGAYAGRALSTNFSGSGTTQTLHLKTLAGVTPDLSVDQSRLTALQTAGADAYVNVAGLPSIFSSGANGFFDEVYNELWFKFALQTEGFNYLRGSNTKVPQTESGIEGLKNTYRKICAQAVSNGYAGPGTWTSPDTFGDPEALTRCVKDIGYYVYALPLSQQSNADRTARKAPLIQIAIKTQGAVHSSNVIVEVNL